MNNNEMLSAKGVYQVECFDSTGNSKWSDIALNVVPNQGKNAMLDGYLGAGGTNVASYMSLITAGTATGTSTYLIPIVTEISVGLIANRVLMTWINASSGLKAATTTVFTFVGDAIITGSMVVSGGSGVLTPGNTTAVNGVLFSAANFTGGAKTVSNGDSLNVTYSLVI